MVFKRFSLISKLVSIILLVVAYGFLSGSFYIKPSQVHYNLFIDSEFSDLERLGIIMATIEWSKATHNVVTYTINDMPLMTLNVENPLFITKVSKDFPQIAIMDVYSKYSTLGFYDQEIPYIAIVPDRTSNFFEFKSLILHELGHSLGLKHVTGSEGINTLMYPSMELGSETITEKDVKNFCKLYTCS